MTINRLSTDYLVIGSGAVGMAFVDTLLSDTDADIVMIDRHHLPGGHWNNAYPFVRLHQPSAFYGVSSRELSNHKLDEVGLNKGLGHLSSGAEVLAYFDSVMQERFLPSGRVRFFPMSEYDGEGRFHSLLSDDRFEVEVKAKTVDATYLKTTIPATHTPGFAIDKDVSFLPPNKLPDLAGKPGEFVVIGGGKTGMDACIWLLENRVDPEKITWIMPRDGWMIDRLNTQPDMAFFDKTLGSQALQFEAIAAATGVDDLFERLESSGVLLRLDRQVKPTMFHGATISQAELAELQRIKNVIRKGRVTRLKRGEIELDGGTLKVGADAVHVDCTASAISNLEPKPVFAGDLITPQTVRSYQPVFSASLIAHVEAVKETEAEKNDLCEVVPLPNHDTDWIRMMVPFMTNQYKWSRDPDLREWLRNNRLDGFSGLVKNIGEDDTDKKQILSRIRESSMPAMANLHKLMAELDRVMY